MKDSKEKTAKRALSTKPGTQRRNKTETMQLFRDAALEIIREEGIGQLKVNKLERMAGRSKRLLYDYFGSLEGLLKEVLENNDPWLSYGANVTPIIDLHKSNHGADLAGILLKNHLVSFSSDKIAQQVSLLELTDKGNKLLKNLSQSREQLGERLFAISHGHFINTDVDIQCVMAILIAGINYMTLHKEANGSTFCGINIKNDEDFKKMSKTLEQISSWAYVTATNEKSQNL